MTPQLWWDMSLTVDDVLRKEAELRRAQRRRSAQKRVGVAVLALVMAAVVWGMG